MSLSKNLRNVQWKDLTKLSRKEMLIENNLSIPWALSSWLLAYYGYYLLAIPFSVLFFLTSFRQAHNGFHNSLGTNKQLTWLSMYLNSIWMMSSVHAFQFNHLRHHKYCWEIGYYDLVGSHLVWACTHFPHS